MRADRRSRCIFCRSASPNPYMREPRSCSLWLEISEMYVMKYARQALVNDAGGRVLPHAQFGNDDCPGGGDCQDRQQSCRYCGSAILSDTSATLLPFSSWQ